MGAGQQGPVRAPSPQPNCPHPSLLITCNLSANWLLTGSVTSPDASVTKRCLPFRVGVGQGHDSCSPRTVRRQARYLASRVSFNLPNSPRR